MSEIKNIIESAFENRASITPSTVDAETKNAVLEAIGQLNAGTARVAEKVAGEWVVHQWLKKAVLLYFRINDNDVMEGLKAVSLTRYRLNTVNTAKSSSRQRVCALCHPRQ